MKTRAGGKKMPKADPLEVKWIDGIEQQMNKS